MNIWRPNVAANYMDENKLIKYPTTKRDSTAYARPACHTAVKCPAGKNPVLSLIPTRFNSWSKAKQNWGVVVVCVINGHHPSSENPWGLKWLSLIPVGISWVQLLWEWNTPTRNQRLHGAGMKKKQKWNIRQIRVYPTTELCTKQKEIEVKAKKTFISSTNIYWKKEIQHTICPTRNQDSCQEGPG